MKFNYVLNRGRKADIIFWLVYSSFWHMVFAPDPLSFYNVIFSLGMSVAQIIAVYIHLNLLLPKRYSGSLGFIPYGAFLSLVTILGAGLTWLILYGSFYFVPYAEGLVASLRYAFFSYWIGPILGSMTMAVASTGAIHLFARKREQDRQARELEHARVNTELQYLRAQINPHFLFNALNGIYFLIPKDPERAAEVLAGFSDLLRYQLYRSDDKQVPLTEELEYLNRFAELSLMRLEPGFKYELEIDLPNAEGRIPPMLLLPLLENAFKHSPRKSGWISGKISYDDEGILCAIIKNNISVDERMPTEETERSGGIGLENIERRLQLLYDNDYSFSKRVENGVFVVELRIPLEQVATLEMVS